MDTRSALVNPPVPAASWRGPRLCALIALALAGCSLPVDQRGNLPTENQIAQIQPGVSDKPTVTRILGSPSSVAAFDANTWYYVSQKTKNVAFFKPELVDQEVYAIEFDKEGLVRDIHHRGLNDRVAVIPNSNATPSPGREFGFWEQLIGNFGRFSGAGSSNPGSGPGGPGGGPGR
jgi:outer membrane protein assembly factor BamE (lipoprotein component of BamABCDE complex)